MSPEPTRKSVLSVTCIVHAVQDGLGAATYILLPILAQTYGLGYAQVGLFKGLKSAAQGLLEISSGIATERIGARRVLLLGLLASGAGFLALANASNAQMVLVCLIVVGVGAAFQHAPASALVSRAFASGSRRGAMGLYNSSGDVGKLLFAGGFSLAIGLGFAWNTVVAGYGLITIATAGLVFFALNAAAHPRRAHNQPGVKQERTTHTDTIGWGVLDRRGFWALTTAIVLDGLVQAGALVFVSFLLLAKGMPLYVASFGAVLILIGGVFGKAGCGFLAEKVGVRRAFAWVQILTAIGLVAVALLPAVPVLALLPLLGVVLQGSTSITYGLVGDLIHPERTQRGFGLVYAAGSMSNVAGPLGLGLLGDALGIASTFYVMAGVSLMAILACLMFPRWLGTGGPPTDLVGPPGAQEPVRQRI